MVKKSRRQFTTEQKVAILRRHLIDKVSVSDLCEEMGGGMGDAARGGAKKMAMSAQQPGMGMESEMGGMGPGVGKKKAPKKSKGMAPAAPPMRAE